SGHPVAVQLNLSCERERAITDHPGTVRDMLATKGQVRTTANRPGRHSFGYHPLPTKFGQQRFGSPTLKTRPAQPPTKHLRLPRPTPVDRPPVYLRTPWATLFAAAIRRVGRKLSRRAIYQSGKPCCRAGPAMRSM